MTKLMTLVHFIFLIAFSSTPALAQSSDEISALERIASTFNEGHKSPGGVITVAKDGAVLYNQAFGAANLEHDILNTVNTVFEAGSVSKQFTATAILLLIDEGKVSLEDDVRTFIPDLPQYSAVIKVKHLLTHTSGLKDWGSIAGVAGWPRGTKAYKQSDARDIIFKQQTTNFLPGSAYSYSNSNFTLLATIVESVTKMSFADFTTKRIFEPVGMTNTRWRDNFRSVVKNRAVGYGRHGNTFVQDMPFEDTHGHGGLLTTTADLLKWIGYWNAEKFGKNVSRLRLTPGQLNDGKEIEYTLGAVYLRKTNGLTEIYHSGITAGYRGWLAYYPEKKIAVACLSNGLTLPSKQLTEVFIGSKTAGGMPRGSELLTESNATKLSGLYKSSRGPETLEILRRNGKVYMKTGAEVLVVNQDTLSTGSRYMKIKPDYSGFLSIIGTDTVSFLKIDKFDPSPKAMEKYIGHYFSAECDAKFDIRLDNNKLLNYRNAEGPIEMKPAYKDAFYMDGVLIEFKLGPNKRPYFNASVDRAKNLVFRQIDEKQ